MTIAINALREKIRRKELYVVSLIGLLILLIFGTGSGSISIDGKPITDYENLAPLMITMINVICGALAIVLSLRTIPNEYERKTSHLIWIRDVSQVRFHGELAVANIIGSLLAEAILYLGLLIFMISKGRSSEIWRLIPAFLIMAISIAIVSLFTSMMSIVLPGMFAGVIATICYVAGVLHGMLELFGGMISGLGSALIKGVLVIIPDLNEIQSQAGNVLKAEAVDAHVIFTGLLALYVISLFVFVCKKKEA